MSRFPNLQICPITDYAHVLVTGRDADTFLHGQLSQDLLHLASGRAPLAGWHDARGRLLVLVRALRLDDGWLLITHESQVEKLMHGMRAFVLRADVGFEIASDFSTLAVIGDAAGVLQPLGIELGDARDATARAAACHFIRVAGNYIEIHGPRSAIERLGLETNTGAESAALEAVALGLPAVTAPMAGIYLPQMLNLDRLGAIAFDKGCYPGQEIIARAHHLGTVKRRLRRFESEPGAQAAIGSHLLDAAGEPIGEVVRVAEDGERLQLLAVVRLTALEESVFLKDAARSTLRELPLPYD